MSIQESGEMYLETIYILSKKLPVVRAIDVGEQMGFSKPSVSRAMGLLKDKGYVTVDSSGGIILTKTGDKLARGIYERHTTLAAALVSLGVDEKTAVEDACRIEHYISDKTFNAIKKHLKEYKG
ncbi:MAG: metal-dependent transcriptional regulator [Clostridia bacterium]|nr:metal-dependent transcriptional regulator [Clostridia bacterium]